MMLVARQFIRGHNLQRKTATARAQSEHERRENDKQRRSAEERLRALQERRRSMKAGCETREAAAESNDDLEDDKGCYDHADGGGSEPAGEGTLGTWLGDAVN